MTSRHQPGCDDVEAIYQTRMAAMAPKERIARTAAMFQWTREMIARRILTEGGPMSAERLKWRVALRLYGNEPEVAAMIRGMLENVPDCRPGSQSPHRTARGTTQVADLATRSTS